MKTPATWEPSQVLICVACGQPVPEIEFGSFRACPHCGSSRAAIPDRALGYCDFCSSAEADRSTFTSFEVDDFAMAVVTRPDGSKYEHISRGAWSACPTCAPMVERGDRAALFERAVANSPTLRKIKELTRGMSPREVDEARRLSRDAITDGHERFFAALERRRGVRR